MRRFCGLMLVLALAALPAMAGTATFSGTLGDNDAHLDGGWVLYSAQGLANPWFGQNPGGEADGVTTNLTALCGSRSLNDLGTITLTLTEPNWDWADYWWGAWLEQQFSIAGVKKVTVGMGSPYDWGGYGWIYVKFGATELKWNYDNEPAFQPAAGNEPLGVRIESDGTNLSLSATKDGTTFFPLTGASWPIDNLPELGDLTAQALDLEIAEYGPCSTIKKFQWTAASVPALNAAALPVAGLLGLGLLAGAGALGGIAVLRKKNRP